MAELLLFRLFAPIAAFGEIAVGERRPSYRHPAHSALIGLICAALGRERDDPLLPRFAEGCAFAILVHCEGRLLVDYHTVQTPAARKGASWRTRREELAGEVNTILSRRDYRTEAAFTIATLADATAPEPLSAIEAALRAPRFTLYVGRKSCPLGQPPDPMRLEAQSLREAFEAYEASRRDWPLHDKIWIRQTALDLHFDQRFIAAGLVEDEETRRAERRDARPDRRLWRFDLREERTMRLAPALAREGSLT